MLGFIFVFLWVMQFIPIFNKYTNWFIHPVYLLLILGKQILVILIILFLFLIEYSIKRLIKYSFVIKSENRLYNFLFKLGYLFLVMPFLILITGFILLPVLQFCSLKIFTILILVAFILEISLIIKQFFKLNF